MTISERLASLGAVRAKVALGDIARLFESSMTGNPFVGLSVGQKLELLDDILDILKKYNLHPDTETKP